MPQNEASNAALDPLAVFHPAILVAEFRMCFHYWWANYGGYGSWRRWYPIALQRPYL
jgi:hypothetical protein